MSGKDDSLFNTIPWCQAYLNDPQYVSADGIKRNRVSDTYDTFISKTLKTSNTIPEVVCLKKIPATGANSFDTITFMSLGSDMNGHTDTAHGGAIATVLDEVAGFVVREWSNSNGIYVTGSLAITYLKPLRTPSIILIKGSTSLSAERKKMVTMHLCDAEHTIATAEALFIKLDRQVL